MKTVPAVIQLSSGLNVFLEVENLNFVSIVFSYSIYWEKNSKSTVGLGGGGGAQRPVSGAKEPKKTGGAVHGRASVEKTH